MKFLPKHKDTKGENGKVLVIGGSTDYTGAPYLAAISALRSGIDWVTVAAPQKTAEIISSYSPDIITRKVKGDFFCQDHIKDMLDLSKDFDAVIIGNGIGTDQQTSTFVKEFCMYSSIPKIIDADAIKLLRGMINKLDNCIITPHKKEFEILTSEKVPKQEEKLKDMLRYFSKTRKIFLLKGPKDYISDDLQTLTNTTGNPGMAIAGTGDVLAGITAGYFIQSKDMIRSAYNASFINGKIGDYLYKKNGPGFLASEITPYIPSFTKRYLR